MENNFIRALHAYDNPQCLSIQEFEKDYRLFSLIKKDFTNLRNKNEINLRRTLNNFVICFNVFGLDAFYLVIEKLEDYLPYVMSFLLVLDRIPGGYLEETKISPDIEILEKLKEMLGSKNG